MDSGALLSIEGQAHVTFQESATFSGTLDNSGLLQLEKDVDFGDNHTIGSILLTGPSNQQIIGTTLSAMNFSMAKSGALTFKAERLEVTNTLNLSSGFIHTGGTALRVIGGSITGGSPASYIDGSLTQVSNGDPLYYPLGLNGNFNSLTVEKSKPGDEIKVGLEVPIASQLIPGDSLIGLADEIGWVITKESTGPVLTTFVIDFEGIDLAAVPNSSGIKASRFCPVISYLDPQLNAYQPLGIRELLDTDSLSYGILSSSKPLSLTSLPQFISIGKMPLLDGAKFFVPNVFSPSSAKYENKAFRPFLAGVEVADFRMTIWDGLNNQVYSDHQSNVMLEDVGWDGSISGDNYAAEGVYYYSISVSTPSGDFSKKGSFILLR